jgi:hypothetical protein
MFIFLILSSTLGGRAGESLFTIDDIILDIYNAVAEFGEVDYEQLQADLYAFHDNPIDLNHTSDEELSRLYLLSPRQIDEILQYADKHPFQSLYELRMIQSLEDYEIRDLLPFVYINSEAINESAINREALYPKEVFAHANHEIITRVDARNVESFEGSDPVYVQTRYKFDYRRRVIFGARMNRPAGGGARDLQYGAYLQLRDIAPHLHTVVGGNFQASFGQGLVLAPVFHTGKSGYVASVGQNAGGLRYYSSVDGAGLHGAGATMRWSFNPQTRLDVSALYSMRRANDSVWHHLVGANLTLRHKRLEVQLTAAEKLWSDSIRPYNNAAYNQHYFRGYNQAVIGASFRYNYGWFDLFGEVATAQNEKWGLGTIVGSRFYPTDGVSLVALYRYYSPYFDNALGYAFSETSRLGDENGGYLGFEVTRLRKWRFSGYADVFYFSGVKYGIPQAGTIGYDVLGEAKYSVISNQHSAIGASLRLRARKKGTTSTYSARFQFDWSKGEWSLRTTADYNQSPITKNEVNRAPVAENNQSPLPYGVSLAQDIAYTFSHLPLALRLRTQFFDARNWDNRIYLYEHDVLYAFSIPATYGLGGRAYLCLRWQIIKQLALYLRVSETVYERAWYIEKHPKSKYAAQSSKIPTRTDVHLLLRATF